MDSYPRIFKNKYGKVTVYRALREGKWYTYKVLWRLGKKRFEERYSHESVALERAEELLGQISSGRELMLRADKDKIAYYVTCEQMLEGKISLMELVRAYLKEREKVEATADLKECLAKYMASMVSRGLSKAHIDSVKSRLTRFVASVPSNNIFDVTTETATEYLSRVDNLSSRFNERAVIRVFFTWCRDQGILPDKDHAFDKADVPRAKWKEPKIIPPGDFARVMAVAQRVYPEIVVPLALGAFAGMRRAEITRMTRESIDMGQGLLTLSAGITKTNQRRVIEINGTLRAWLEDYLTDEQDFNDPSYKFKARRCVLHAKAEWPDNGLRHSYVSYRVQSEKDTRLVAYECGHSPEILNKHYRCLCSPKDAEAWFDILPETAVLPAEELTEVVPELAVDSV